MYRRSFPRCSVPGPVDPVPFTHMGQEGAIPRKCSGCRFMLEAECLRGADHVQGFLALDHGPCPVRGETKPITYENKHVQSKVFIPTKCGSCRHLNLSIHSGFTCKFEHEKWGAHHRELDWGAWSPEHPNLGLSSGRSVSLDLLQAVHDKNEVAGIKAFRTSFPEATIREARDAYAELLLQWPQGGA